jgi:hypothetical protein
MKKTVLILLGLLCRITTRISAGQPKNRGSIPSSGRDFSLLYKFQTAYEAHPAFYALGKVKEKLSL